MLNAAFAMAILDLISQVHLPSFVNTLTDKRNLYKGVKFGFWPALLIKVESASHSVVQTVRYFWFSLWKDGGTLLFPEDDRVKEWEIFIRKYIQVIGFYFLKKYVQVIGYMY